MFGAFFEFITHLFSKHILVLERSIIISKNILECADGYFHNDCSGTCGYCVNGEVCEKTGGHCLNGCMTNYQQPLCKGIKLNNQCKLLLINNHVYIKCKMLLIKQSNGKKVKDVNIFCILCNICINHFVVTIYLCLVYDNIRIYNITSCHTKHVQNKFP